MSDGISEAYAEQASARHYADYLMAVATHLVVRTQDTLEKLKEKASWVDKEQSYEADLIKLLDGDRVMWSKFALDCQSNSSHAFTRIQSIVPWSDKLMLVRIQFDNWSELGKFWRPFFDRAGFATDRGNGNRNGYDSYALLYESWMSIEHIVENSTWLGFKTTGWPGNSNVSPIPTTPLKKDRVKNV